MNKTMSVETAPAAMLLELIRSGQVEAVDVVRICNERPDVLAAIEGSRTQ
jgi:hypothetical protein